MIKKQIASLNKQINNCVNYLESTRLRKELNNKERKLKELEKKEKQKSNNIERSFYTAERLASLDLAVSAHEDANESLGSTYDYAATASPIPANEARSTGVSATAYLYDSEQSIPYISFGNNRIYATSADLSAINSLSSLNY